MKVTINDRRSFRFPTWLVVNDFTAGILCRKLKKQGLNFTRKQIAVCIREIKRYKKDHAEWNLIEAEDADGKRVVIKI